VEADMKVKVIAKEVQYGGKGRLRGEEFDADSRWASGRILLRQVEEVPGKPYRQAAFVAPPVVAEPLAAPAAEAVADVVETPRRSYRTRVLKADDE
jgi:hypothetical protein